MDSAVPATAEETPFRYLFSEGLPDFLRKHGISLLVTTYQAGKLMAVRAGAKGLSTLLRTFEQPMGLALDGGRLAVGTRNAVWILRHAADIASQIEPRGQYDACFIPRLCHITGNIRGHEMAWSGKELWVVNTRFSCLCVLDEEFSFVPRWRPRFISAYAAEDRCHLNGLAMDQGQARYVTALGESDTAEGWRPTKASGGIVIDVATGEVVCRGLAMPHSPRLHQGRLWVLDSGRGELQVVDVKNGQRNTVAALPGYARGLSFCGRFAVVGLSRIREKREFGGLPLEARARELKCGIWVIDVTTGECAGHLEFERGCEEIFAVEVLSNARYPEIISFKEDTINNVFLVPFAD